MYSSSKLTSIFQFVLNFKFFSGEFLSAGHLYVKYTKKGCPLGESFLFSLTRQPFDFLLPEFHIIQNMNNRIYPLNVQMRL